MDLPRCNDNESLPLLRDSVVCTTQDLPAYAKALGCKHVNYSVEVIRM